MSASDPKEITSGTIGASIYVASTDNQDESVVVQIKGDTLGVIYQSGDIAVPANSTGIKAIVLHTIGSTPVPAGEVITATVKGTSDDLTVKGSEEPSHIKITRKNL